MPVAISLTPFFCVLLRNDDIKHLGPGFQFAEAPFLGGRHGRRSEVGGVPFLYFVQDISLRV